MTTPTYRIGEVATAADVSVDTLRFYERERLLPPAVRSTGGARRYSGDVVGRVKFIKQAQAVGLTLKDIRVLVDLRQRPAPAACRKTRAILADRIQELQRRMQEMHEFQAVLSSHLEACDRALGRSEAEECPALDALERRAAHGVTQ
jgi:MerR family Zn(II)-responsive transcriptional regulator of zntA